MKCGAFARDYRNNDLAENRNLGRGWETSVSTGTHNLPLGFNPYYSFGGAGKSPSVYYAVTGAGGAVEGAYTANFTSTRITPVNIGSIGQGNISFNALANIGSSGVATNTEIVVLDSNDNVYVDTVPRSATNGRIATNDNGSASFSRTRNFNPGTYYIAIGISSLSTNDAAARDDASQGNQVLDFDNVLATNNTFYNGSNGGNTRPADFSLTNSFANVTYTRSGQVIPSLYAVNFYRFTVLPTPEPGSLLLAAGPLGLGIRALRRGRRARKTRNEILPDPR